MLGSEVRTRPVRVRSHIPNDKIGKHERTIVITRIHFEHLHSLAWVGPRKLWHVVNGVRWVTYRVDASTTEDLVREYCY